MPVRALVTKADMALNVRTVDPLRAALELERLMIALPGVRGARVEAGASGIERVRVLVLPERDEALTVKEVRSLAMSHLGTDLPADRISILNASAPGKRRVQRRRLSSLMTERVGRVFKTRVTLEVPGDILIGEKEAPAGELFENRSVAGAVLDGLDELVDFPVEVEAVDVMQHGEQRVAVVLLMRESDRLIGSALVRSTEHDAVARATLDALNRFLGASYTQDVV